MVEAPLPILRDDQAATLLKRVRAALSAEFGQAKPLRLSRAPGHLDVMGGIAEDTGSLVVTAALDRAATVALQERDDRQVQVFSFNQFDQHQPFTLRIPLEALAKFPPQKLREEFNASGRQWAGHVAGCLYLLHESKLIDLADPKHKGLNLAILSTVPPAVGAGASAAMEVAAMLNFIEHFGIRNRIGPVRMASLCRQVQARVLGEPCGIAAYVGNCLGEAGSLLPMVCQPHELRPMLPLPPGVRVLGINSNVRRSDRRARYEKTRLATFMGQQIILAKMREMGRAAGRTLTGDPLRGYLANLDPDHYKMLFRPILPDAISGQSFIDQYGAAAIAPTTIEPDKRYLIRHALDHHVLEARRVRRFTEFLQTAATAQGTVRKTALDSAGHLMYASHQSYMTDAMLGAEECDLLVQMVRALEPAGLYGARITGAGSGGVVAVLAEHGQATDAAISEITKVYEQRTGLKSELFPCTGSGAWAAGSCRT
jgi:L-arabinokinase